MSFLGRLLALFGVSGPTELVAGMIGLFLFFGGIRLLVLVLHLLLHCSRLLLAILVLALLVSLRSEVGDLLLLFVGQFFPLIDWVLPILNS